MNMILGLMKCVAPLLILFLYNCFTNRGVGEITQEEVRVNKEQDIANLVQEYNIDSSYKLLVLNETNNPEPINRTVIILKDLNNDTVFFSKNEYKSAEWQSEMVVKLKKRKSLPNRPEELGAVNQEAIIYYYNISSGKLKNIKADIVHLHLLTS